MTDVLTVVTHFGDLSELQNGLIDRVDQERMILYGPDPFEEGSRVPFSVLLMDGTSAIEGTGRVVAAVDGGEERAPETRFDIHFDELQLDSRSGDIFQGIILARQSMMGEAPVEEAQPAFDAPPEEAAFEAPAESFEQPPADPFESIPPQVDAGAFVDGDADSTMVASVEEMEQLGAEAAADVFTTDVEPDAVADVAFDAPAEAFTADEGDVSFEASADVGDVAFDAPADPLGGEEAASFEQPSFDANAADAFEAPADDFAAGGFDADDLAGDVSFADEPEEAPLFGSQAPPANIPGLVEIGDAPALPAAPPNFVLPVPETILTRPAYAASWQPEASAAPEPRPSTGHFHYPNGLPVPAAPPRPELDPAYRVPPAPRPGDAQIELPADTGASFAAVAAPAAQVFEGEAFADAQAPEAFGDEQFAADGGEFAFEQPAEQGFDAQPEAFEQAEGFAPEGAGFEAAPEAAFEEPAFEEPAPAVEGDWAADATEVPAQEAWGEESPAGAEWAEEPAEQQAPFEEPAAAPDTHSFADPSADQGPQAWEQPAEGGDEVDFGDWE